MSDNTIAFREDMIDLILSGKKTVTIRPMNPQPEKTEEHNGLFQKTYWEWKGIDLSEKCFDWLCERYPHGRTGDVITIRGRNDIQLKIRDIRIERLHNIDRNWWKMDGLTFDIRVFGGEEKIYYHWQGFYGDTEYRWANNPWVWVVAFELVEGGKA